MEWGEVGMGSSTLLGLLLARVAFPKCVDDGVGAGQWSRGRAPPAATRVTRAALASLQQPAQSAQLPVRVNRSRGRVPRAATRVPHAALLQLHAHSALHRYSNLRGARSSLQSASRDAAAHRLCLNCSVRPSQGLLPFPPTP